MIFLKREVLNMRQEVYPGIVKDTEIAHGKPTIAGTRIPVTTILGAVVGEGSIEDVCIAYEVTREQVQAALGYASELVNREAIQPDTTDSDLPPEVAAVFEEEFDPESPGMQYLRDR
jgi:uncharacterized protein (DUF433 family)